MNKALVYLAIVAAFLSSASVFAGEPGDSDAIQACLSYWVHSPFKGNHPSFRVVFGGTQVFGESNFGDSQVTNKPELVLVKPGATVFGDKTIRLMNPQGWYCLDGSVTALGTTKIDLSCSAKYAPTETGVAIVGSNAIQSGTTVFGNTTIRRVDCNQTSAAASGETDTAESNGAGAIAISN